MLKRERLRRNRIVDGNGGAPAPRKRLSFGLAPRVVGLVVATALISGAIVGWLSVDSSRSALQDQILTDYQSQSDLAAEFSRRYAESAQQTLNWLATQPTIITAVRNENFSGMAALLPVFLSIEPKFENITLVDRNGNQQARASGGDLVNVADREWFQIAKATGRPYVSLPTVGQTSGKPLVSYVVPVVDEAGQTVAMFVGNLSLETLSNGLTASAASDKVRLTLIDRRGTGVVIADEDVSRILQPIGASDAVLASVGRLERDAISTTGPDGKDRLTATAPVVDLPWSVLVEQDSASALAPVNDVTRRILLISAAVILAAVALSAWLALQITRPLARLRTAVHGVASGDLRRRLGFTQRDEIGEVGRAFDVMADAVEARTADVERVVTDLRVQIRAREETEAALERSHAELETRVEERTRELASAYEALRQREEDFRLLVDGARDYALILLDTDGRVVTWNDGARRVYGYEASEIIGKDFSVFTPDTDPASARRVLENTIAEGSISVEGWRLRKDGSRFWASVIVTALRGPDGEIRGFSRLTRDDTAQREANERLRESEERFRLLVDGALDYALFMLDPQGHVATWNDGAERMHGYEADEILGRHFEMLFPPEDRERRIPAQALEEAAANGSASQEGWRLRKDGSRLWASVVFTAVYGPDGSLRGFSRLGRDITAQRAAEERLRDSEERFRALIERNTDGIVLTDRDGIVTYVSPSVERVLGVSEEEIVGTNLRDRMHPDDLERLNESSAALLATPGASQSAVWRVRHQDGSWRWIESVRTNLFELPAVGATVTNFRDITERRELDEHIRLSEERFRALIEKSSDGIALTDAEGIVTYVSPSNERMLGYTAGELIGRPAAEIIHPDDIERLQASYDELLAEPGVSTLATWRMHHKDGSWRWLEATGTNLLDDPAVQAVVSNFRDITERREMERALEETVSELRRSNAELEQFAYVASHDLQEPLRMVSNYTQLLSRRYKGKLDDDADVFIGYAVEAAGRMQQLINDLLHFSRVGTRGGEFAPTEMDAALSRALRNLETAVEESGAVIEREPLPAVNGDEVQLAQVMQNLIANAIKFRGEEPLRIRVGAHRDGDSWLFSVSDNGIGIDKAYFERIFVIFQRLHGREEYPGTGIGLALCKRIVERHRGRIWVESSPGEGATFYFTLPAMGRRSDQEPNAAIAEKTAA